jgi:hypothetical protein
MSNEHKFVDTIERTIRKFFRRKSKVVITPIPEAPMLTELFMPTVSSEEISFAYTRTPRDYGATNRRSLGT